MTQRLSFSPHTANSFGDREADAESLQRRRRNGFVSPASDGHLPAEVADGDDHGEETEVQRGRRLQVGHMQSYPLKWAIRLDTVH